MRRFWLGYCVLLLMISITRSAERTFLESGGFASRYLPVISTIILCVGIYHCLENKPFLHQYFWRLIYWLLIILNIVSFGSVLIISLYQLNHLWQQALPFIGISCLLFPALIKIKQYATLKRIWGNSY